MSKVVRIATAAAFGVVIAGPALAEDINTQSPGDVRQPVFSQNQPGSGADPRSVSPHSVSPHHDRAYRGRVDWSMAGSSNELGSPAGDMPSDREIRLGANARGISVNHGETVKFVAADGREFRWRFDPLARVTSIPLASIAPQDMSIGQGARVYVGESEHS